MAQELIDPIVERFEQAATAQRDGEIYYGSSEAEETLLSSLVTVLQVGRALYTTVYTERDLWALQECRALCVCMLKRRCGKAVGADKYTMYDMGLPTLFIRWTMSVSTHPLLLAWSTMGTYIKIQNKP